MSKTIGFLATASVLAFAHAASAADLIVDVPVTAGVVEASGDWDGVYAGLFGGGLTASYGDNGPTSGEESAAGWLLGVDIGADFTVADGVVAGVVADVAWAGAGFGSVSGPAEYNFDINWAASLRGKLGFDAGSFLPYLTAGLAVAGTSYDYTSPGPVFDETAVHLGWTIGMGVEVALTEDLSLDLLYRYSDYGDETYAADTAPYEAGFSTHAVTVGINWRF